MYCVMQSVLCPMLWLWCITQYVTAVVWCGVSSQGCSGDFGTSRLWSPLQYTSEGEDLQQLLPEIEVNITVPPSITGRGGEALSPPLHSHSLCRSLCVCVYVCMCVSMVRLCCAVCCTYDMLYVCYMYAVCGCSTGTIQMSMQYSCVESFCSSE